MPLESITIQPAWKSYFVFYAAMVILGLGPLFNPDTSLSREAGLFIAAGLIAFVYLKRKTTFYRMTEQEISKEFRWGGRTIQAKTMPLRDLAGVAVRRGMVHRLIGVGQLQFRSKIDGSPELWWYGVDQPFEVKRRIEAFRSEGQPR